MGIPDALLRGVIAGVAGQMLAWIAAIVLWQHLLDGEAKSARASGQGEPQPRPPARLAAGD